MDSKTPPSWDEYQRELEQKQNKTLFNILPGGLQRLLYGSLVAEIESADQRRQEIEKEYHSLNKSAREITSTVEEMIRGPRRRGEPLPSEAQESLRTLEEIRADLSGLLQDNKQFLRTSEQTTAESLRSDVKELESYLKAKREQDAEISEIQGAIEALESEIQAECSAEGLLSEETESELRERVSKAEGWITSAKEDIETRQLSETDLERFDELFERTSGLRQRVTIYNESQTEDTYKSLIGRLESEVPELKHEVEQSREEGVPLPREHDEIVCELDPLLESIADFLSSRSTEYISAKQEDELRQYGSILQRTRKFVNAKSAFDNQIEVLEEWADELKSTVEDIFNERSYLATPEQRCYEKRFDEAQSRVVKTEENIDLNLLANSDRSRFESIASEIANIRGQLEGYNQKLIEQQRDKYEETFSGFGDDDLSLNAEQELAVYRNDIHNQVIAGAGTGKTFSLSCRVKYLVEEGVSEDDILAMTFTRKAATEMSDRLDEMFDISGVETSTLHSFGNRALNEIDPTLVQIEDQSRLREVGRLIRSLYQADQEFRKHYDEFLELYKEANLKDDDKERRDFLNSLRYKSDTTLRGEEVQSRFNEEKDAHTSVADLLFKHDISYHYRKYAAWAGNPKDQAYIPDFSLPEHNIVIEYLPSEPTRQRKRWYNQKRSRDEVEKIFEGTDQTLLIVSGDQTDPSRVETVVKTQLEKLGVTFESPLRGKALRDETYEHNICWRDVESTFAEFVKKAKTNRINPEDQLDNLSESEDEELYHFSHAATRLLQEYQSVYDRYNAYDFVDMIVMATDAIKSGEIDNIAQFRHVMVDEFQDLNLVQIEFVQALLSRHDDARLFAVGDDWQSIYGFKGARPDYFIDFADHFSPAVETRLETNYRCPPSVVKAGNDLIKNNEAKTDKTVTAHKSLETTPRVHLVPGSDDFQYRRNGIKKIVQLVKSSVRESDRKPNDVMVLARNQSGSPFIREISKRLRDADIPVGGENGVEVTKAHQAKGKEAGHVIIANAAGGMSDGFPPTERDRSLTQLVEIDTGSHMDEERRLFYVALTRAEERLDIQSRVDQQSPFLDEIQNHVITDSTVIDPDAERTTITVTAEDTREAKPFWNSRQLGTLVTKDGYKLKFVIEDEATDIPLLEEEHQYRIDDVVVGEYEGDPQFQIDADTSVTPVDSLTSN
ncbi:DNA/RNA helicase, superfamily I [Halogeometricum borinquense DSM 11551]|uniref:DNA 3'-5' helicase n=1 Tax=Halogeometricum borinquense (strain ATCC 700274 / DSM 11551 / JCM 10706 / KCTC 4070 / PR3) TaxID=469382 RepID=E4NVA5_HALBP|nr:UvrD-helicase domain-containing protein [Halogeometricum borinquense]ADQ69094.1 DNA/RNA helicase, superfamily I [Halogeometricum borinquense DSM 11551]ELY29405.1 DNA/RNA helicase, superfamily I [Halogeometricum borinquense DSM 11551]